MTIRYKCPECGATLKIKDDLAGTDGKCPQCKTAFQVPNPVPLDSDTAIPALAHDSNAEIPTADAGNATPQPDSEDDIFGKDFFSLQAPSTRPKYTLPAFDDDHVIPDEEPPTASRETGTTDRSGETGTRRKPGRSAPGPGADNAADIAGSLLAKTGKKNRPEDAAPAPEDDGGYDYSEVKWLLKARVAPIVGGTTVAVYLLYSLMMSVMSSGAELPPLGQVRGTVLLDGQPVPAGCQVQFIPVESTGQASGSLSVGVIGEKGEYEAQYSAEVKGAVVGQHQVRVTIGGRRYEQSLEVKSGDNEHNLEFQSM